MNPGKTRNRFVPGFAPALILACGALAAGSAGAASVSRYADYADVLRVQPISTTVRVSTPRQECREVPVARRDSGPRSYTPMILGGILGGVVGNQFGSGNGKKLMTAAGVALGGSLGRDAASRHGRHYAHTSIETQCRTEYDYREEQRIDGYLVEYSYQGRTYETRMDYDPGDRVRIKVDISLAE
jgi:uncharacterized protein YcfJ